MKNAAAFALVLLTVGCAPAASPQRPSPSATTIVAPTATATLTASASPTASSTWAPITLPNSATLSAPPGEVLWALVAVTRVFRSSDRGTTWQERTIPASIPTGDIAFISDREGWLSAPGSPATQCETQSVGIYHTADGAATWERLYQSDFLSDPLCKNGLFFADTQRGFLTLTSPTSNSLIQRTTDGGRTWARSQPLPDPPGFTSAPAGSTLVAGRVKAVGAMLLVSAVAGGTGNDKAYAFRSTDGGATWIYVSTAPQPGTEIVFLTATRWLQINLPGRSSETSDAGLTWHAFAADYQQAAPINPQIVFGDANVGYATVRGQIQRTTDGGAHWSVVKTPGT